MENNTIRYLKENHLEKGIKLSRSINATNSILEEMMKELNSDTRKLQREEKFNEIIEIVKLQKNINNTIKENEKLIEEFQDEGEPIKSTTEDDYSVDIREPHSLEEDFSFTRPHSFQVERTKIEAKTWKEILVKTAEYLHNKNPEIFKTFLTDEDMSWGDKFNFNKDQNELREGIEVGNSNIYIEAAKTANAVRQLVKRMLRKYDIKDENFKIFLRADYTERQELQNIAENKK